MKNFFRVKIYGRDLNVIHLTFKTQHQMTLTLLRLQEFYECSSLKFKNKFFDLEDYMDWQAKENGEFDYLHRTVGMNVPGNVIVNFFETYPEDKLSKKEFALKNSLQNYLYQKDLKFYLIATYENCSDAEVFDHEIAHAMYYVDEKYRKKQIGLVKKLSKLVRTAVIEWFSDMHYSKSVVTDEIHAYLATSSNSELTNKLGHKNISSVVNEIRLNFVLARNAFLKETKQRKDNAALTINTR